MLQLFESLKLFKSRCIVFHRNHRLPWNIKAILRCVRKLYVYNISQPLSLYFRGLLLFWSVLLCLCLLISQDNICHWPTPLNVHSCLTFFKCVLNCAPMCTYVSVFLKCAHAPMFTHSHGSQYSFTAQLDLGCFLSIYLFCLSLVFHLYKY